MAGLFSKIMKVCTTTPLKRELSHLQQTLQWPLDPLWNMVQVPEHCEIARNFGIILCTRPRSKMLEICWFGTAYTRECRSLSLIFLWGIGPLSWLYEGPDAAKSISPEDPYWNRSETLEISLRWQAFAFSWDLVDNLWHLEVLPWCLDVLLLLVPQTQAPVWTTSWWKAGKLIKPEMEPWWWPESKMLRMVLLGWCSHLYNDFSHQSLEHDSEL